MPTRQKPSFEDRVQEYVDSPMMTHRLRHGKYVSAQIRAPEISMAASQVSSRQVVAVCAAGYCLPLRGRCWTASSTSPRIAKGIGNYRSKRTLARLSTGCWARWTFGIP
jgi:hypothetical protein